ncbi:ABC transporter ATP-binding protein [Gemella cuniculi]|uniref:ABC transporter ATP-binding protein n=1 Tax=Gemella cuniculi TaxID=150240 RepID=UPI000419569B|nr:ABC transporter ATP-binding protein [Gemella cuniculi]
MKNFEFSNVNFAYEDGREVLKNTNLSVNSGEIALIVGDSGSGKSTLLNILNGMIPEVIEGRLDGKVYIEEKENLKIYERNLVLGNVFQNPRSQFFTNNTTAELVFAMENYAFSFEEMKKRLEGVVAKFNVKNLLERNIFELSSGQRQLLALLTVLIMKPNAVVFDEPSANLDYGNAMRLRKQILDLKKEGRAIIVADHRYYYLEGIIDKVFLIKDKTVIEFKTEEDFENSDYGKRVFKLFTHNFEVREVAKKENATVCLNNVTYKDILKNISATFNKGEVTTIVGVNGAGKTTLARIISGLIKVDKGSVSVKEKVFYIMQDADFQLFGASVLKELEITSKNSIKNEKALKLLELWHLKDKHPQTLSGGEKQRLQLAISLVSEAKIIIFDEPTSGLDKNSMERVLNLLKILKEEKTLIVISHDYEFIRRSTDKVIYIKDSKINDKFYLEKDNIKKLNSIYKQMEDYYE